MKFQFVSLLSLSLLLIFVDGCASSDTASDTPPPKPTVESVEDVKPEVASQKLYQAAQTDIQKQDWEAAFKKLDMAVKTDPDHNAALADLGWVYLELEQFHNAAHALKKAAAKFPERADIQANLAAAYAGSKQWDKSAQAAQKAAELDSGNASAYETLGLAHFMNKQYGSAITSYSKSLSLSPGNANVTRMLGMSYCYNNDRSNALKALNKLKNLGDNEQVGDLNNVISTNCKG